VRMLCGCRAAHWASLGPFDMVICYRISVSVSCFYHAYKSHGWVPVTPTWSFIISIILLRLALALPLLPHFAFDLHTCFLKAMACCNPLSEAAASMTEAEGVDKVTSTAEVTQTASENHVASDAKGHISSPDTAKGSLDEGGSDDENLRTYYFGSLTVTVGKIKEMMEKGYFDESEARAPGAKTVPKSDNDEAIVYEEFIVAGLRMPLHCALADTMFKFQTQLHQLTANAIAQLSKYFWAVDSFRGIPEGNVFAKRYELHY
jgi:hypothetical protein